MKQKIESLLHHAIKELQEAGLLPAIPAFIQVQSIKEKNHGDFTSNVAFILSKLINKTPYEIATIIVAAIKPSSLINKIEIAQSGFINFFLSNEALTDIVKTILEQKENFGFCKIGREKRVLIEFVSSNPTGPLNIIHGRHAAFGDAIANLLDAVGFIISREYYVNDSSSQVDLLMTSVWLKYLALCEHITISIAALQFHDQYVDDIAQAIFSQHENHFCAKSDTLFSYLKKIQNQPEFIQELIAEIKNILGNKYPIFLDLTLAHILADIREDLAEFNIHFDRWFSEKEMLASDIVDHTISTLKATGHVYEKDRALWFRTTDFNDVKDRILVDADGKKTYFANDVAYHLNKFERGFDIAIDVLADHYRTYMPRMKAAIQASGINPERLQAILMQYVNLLQKKNAKIHSNKTNEVTLRALRQVVGNDATRFFFLQRKSDQFVEFDLALAKKQSQDNPVFYLQYAHARICSVFKTLHDKGFTFDETDGIQHLNLLSNDEEHQLLNILCRYPDMIITAAIHYEPHLITKYLRELATQFHRYYNSQQFLVDNPSVRNARLALIMAVKQTLKNGLSILRISAPEKM